MRTTAVAIALACGLVLGGCGDVPGPLGLSGDGPCDEALVVAAEPARSGSLVAAGLVLADGPAYDSVEALSHAADVVVLGEVGEQVGTYRGGGFRVPVRRFAVAEVLAGDGAGEVTVALTLGDTSGESCAPVVEGAEVILFLTRAEDGASDTPAGVDAGEPWFVLVGSHHNGVLTVDGDRVLTHSWLPDRLRDSDAAEREPPPDGSFPPPGLAFDLDDVRDVLGS